MIMENINKYILNEADGDSVEASTSLPPQDDVALEMISKNDIVKDSTRILTDKNWELWKPNSQEGLKSLAEGTRWLVKTWWDKEDYTPAENWVYNKWNGVYVIMDRNNFEKRYIFITGYAGMYTPSTTQYSLATWLITNNLNKFIKWFADKDLPFISKRLKSHTAASRIKSSDGVLTYPSDAELSYRSRANVNNIVIEPNTKRINGYALSNLKSVLEIEIPGSVKIIGKFAFSGNNFETLKLNEGLEKIEDGAFGYSSSLKKVVIPRTVKKIGHNAFYQSESLTSFFIPSTVETVGMDIFYQYGGWNVDAQEPLVTVYCESPSKPAGWDDLWDAWQHIRDQQVKRVKVVWGASRPSVNEEVEKESNLEVTEYVKPELRPYGWIVVSIKNKKGLIELPKGNFFEWDPNDYINSDYEEKLDENSNGYVIIDIREVANNNFDIYLYDPTKPKIISWFSEGGTETVTSFLDYNKLDVLKRWFARKFPVALTESEESNLEKETEDDDNLKVVKDEKLLYEDGEWKIIRPITFDKLIEYAKSEKTGKSWAFRILKYDAPSYDTESLEKYFYDEKQKKLPYVIILNKKNKKNYLFLIHKSSTIFSLKTEYVIDTNNEELDFYGFIKNKSLEFQNFFKRQFKSLAYDISSAQQKQKVLKEYGGVYEYPNTEKIEYRAKEHYKKIIIKEGTNKIEDYAFEDFEIVKSVEIPESVSVIGEGAFENMGKLRNIFLPKNVQIIGKAAFHYCLNLKKIYCEAPSKPEGWHEDWNMYNKHMGGKHEVIWGASRPNVNEKVEEESDLEETMVGYMVF